METTGARPRTIRDHMAFVLSPPRFWRRAVPRAALVPLVIAFAFSAIHLPLVHPITSWGAWVGFVRSELYITLATLCLVVDLAFTNLYRYGRLPRGDPPADNLA